MNNVIITGTSNGFGHLSALAFAEAGYRVWATMRNANGSNREPKELLEAAPGDIRVLDMDVADDASVEAAVTQVIDVDSKVDVLINNAGIMYIGHTEAYSVEQAHEQMNVNYYGVIRTTQAVLPAMRRAGGGLIINTSSTAGRVAYPYFGTYGATKFAVEAYSQSLSYEMAPHGIDIAIVEPGPFPTNLINSVQPEARRHVLDDYGPLKDVPAGMLAYFTDFFTTDAAPDNQLVVDAYLALVAAEPGDRPTRTHVGIEHGVTEINRLTQPIQDNIVDELGLTAVLARP
ncbi:MAG: SDR family oxidoreductase [Ilumatobacter sp.]|jgi:NAD(P)-dependent dehydrogenase (short-subunit alcohol dehydrogenase family)|uniref:SDR family oxidoreductase n=1 Tax=Ilumatobacter sp. TaxID=1967498 RepID=UPI003919D0F4